MTDIIMKIGLNTHITTTNIHRLIHITSTPPYTDSDNDFASPTALNIVARMKRTPARRILPKLQDASRAYPHIAALCGYIFEPKAIDLN
ncbi:hypothetical protein DFS34DRAFT_629704 [Phlyctochytrium arcticum]|nr:hypothetical protein DFS34DRAFT_629704 [Phlyctochytrium arcticum]